MTSVTQSNSLPSATSAFIKAYASINNLPPPTSVLDSPDLPALSFDWYVMYWFSFLANILDRQLEDFANKMNFVSTIQQKLSDVSTVFTKLKVLTTYGSNGGLTTDDLNDLSKAFYSLIRMKAQLSATWLMTAFPEGTPYKYNLNPNTGIGVFQVTAGGHVIGSADGANLYYVPNPFKDSSLASKIGTLLTSLKETNTTQTTAQNYSSVTAYNGNLVSLLLKNDPYYTGSSSKNTAFYEPWSSSYMAPTADIMVQVKGLSTQYISFQNSLERYVTTASSSVLSDASTDASAGVTAAQSVSSQVEIELDQYEQIENMYSNIRSQVQQTIAQRNLLLLNNISNST